MSSREPIQKQSKRADEPPKDRPNPIQLNPPPNSQRHLLAVDMGLRTGLALYGPDGAAAVLSLEALRESGRTPAGCDVYPPRGTSVGVDLA